MNPFKKKNSNIVLLEEIMLRRKMMTKDKTRHILSLFDLEKMKIIGRSRFFEYRNY